MLRPLLHIKNPYHDQIWQMCHRILSPLRARRFKRPLHLYLDHAVRRHLQALYHEKKMSHRLHQYGICWWILVHYWLDNQRTNVSMYLSRATWSMYDRRFEQPCMLCLKAAFTLTPLNIFWLCFNKLITIFPMVFSQLSRLCFLMLFRRCFHHTSLRFVLDSSSYATFW